MNSKVEPDELGRVIAGYELVQLSIGDNSLPGWYQHMRFHARVHVATPGSHTQGNGGTRPAASLGWAPREPTVTCWSSTARWESDRLVIAPTRATLCRAAAP